MQYTNKAEKMKSGKRAAFGEVVIKKGAKLNKTTRGLSNKRNWQE